MARCRERPLHWLSISDDFYPEFRALLKDPHEIDDEGNTLLHVAAQSHVDNSRIVQLLIDRGANVNSTNPDGYTPLHFAVVSRNRYAVFALIEAGVSVNSKDLLGRTALHFSVSTGQLHRLYSLIISDCDMWIVHRILCHPETCLDVVDRLGETPLMCAVEERNLDAVKALLKKGANPNIPNISNQTPLHAALSSPDPIGDIVLALLKNGSGIYSVDKSRKTPIDILVRYVRDHRTYEFAALCLYQIAFRYRITESLMRKVYKIPYMLDYLLDCCIEARLMKKLVIYDKVTLHDFCFDCFQTPVGDTVREIYRPIVEILLSGLFQIYYDLILRNLSQSNLLDVLKVTVGNVYALDLVPPNASRKTILSKIRRFYNRSFVLKRRLFRFKRFKYENNLT